MIEGFTDANKDFAPVFRFMEFADSNINFRITFQAVDRVATITIRHEIIIRLHERFKEEGIEINYPVRRISMPETEGHVPDRKSPPKDGNTVLSSVDEIPDTSPDS